MGFFRKTVRHTQRISEIAGTLIQFGMGDLLHILRITDIFPALRRILPKRESRSLDQFSRPEEFRLILEQLGPTFVKLGQMLSNRPDILSLDMIRELEKLQDTVPPFPGEEAVNIIEAELGKPLDELFSCFEKEPVACASIAQVHRAELPDGTFVAVKVCRPNIEETISTDLEILASLAELAERNIEELKNYDPVGIVREFETSIRKELDFNLERQNLERFCRNFKDDRRIFVPRAYKSHSSKKVLTMEFVEGVKVSRITDEDLPGYDRKAIARAGAGLVLEQIFIDGFFHADPHPGNIIILENGTVCFIDFGIMGTLMDRQREELSDLILALVFRDSALISNSVLVITRRPNHPRLREIEGAIQDLVNRYLDLPLAEMNIAEILKALIGIINTFGLKIPPNLTLMAKTIMIIEGVGLQLDPDFQIFGMIQHFSRTIIRQRLDPKYRFKASMLKLVELNQLADHAPADISSIIRKLKQGRVRLEFEHHGLEPLLRSIDTAGNRIIAGVTIGSLIIGSSIMVHADIAPKWHGVPIIGVAGFLISGILALLVFILAMYRHFKDR